MKHLDSKVNIIPIIAKSDTISKNELARFKQNILNELNSAGVKIYRFPTDDETLAEDNLKANVGHTPPLSTRDPFAPISESSPIGRRGQQRNSQSRQSIRARPAVPVGCCSR